MWMVTNLFYTARLSFTFGKIMKKLVKELLIVAVVCLAASGYLAGEKAGSHQNMLIPIPEESVSGEQFRDGRYVGRVVKRSDGMLFVMYSKEGDRFSYYFLAGAFIIIVISKICKYQVETNKKKQTEQDASSDR